MESHAKMYIPNKSFKLILFCFLFDFISNHSKNQLFTHQIKDQENHFGFLSIKQAKNLHLNEHQK